MDKPGNGAAPAGFAVGAAVALTFAIIIQPAAGLAVSADAEADRGVRPCALAARRRCGFCGGSPGSAAMISGCCSPGPPPARDLRRPGDRVRPALYSQTGQALAWTAAALIFAFASLIVAGQVMLGRSCPPWRNPGPPPRRGVVVAARRSRTGSAVSGGGAPYRRRQPQYGFREKGGRVKRQRRSVTRRVLARGWMLIIAAVVVGAAGFAVYRLQGCSARVNTSTPGRRADEITAFNPKTVVLEVFGDPGRPRGSATPTSTPSRSTSTRPRCPGPTRTPPPPRR